MKITITSNAEESKNLKNYAEQMDSNDLILKSYYRSAARSQSFAGFTPGLGPPG